jgi:AcrR family transcriptional regulator
MPPVRPDLVSIKTVGLKAGGTAVTSVLPPARRTRPPNRRELILAAATELFAVRGYEYVGMSEIAEEVAVQPSALYRHFAGKEQLLAEILREGAASLLAGFVIDNRHVIALVGREAPHLGEASRVGLRAELAQAGELLAAKIGLGGAAVVTLYEKVS